MVIESKVIPNAVWRIKCELYYHDGTNNRVLKSDAETFKRECAYIETLNPVIYFNDLECCHWCFDVKLPTGGWLENIRVAWVDGKQIFTGLILV